MRLPPPVRRVVIGGLVLIVGWIAFVQVLPHAMIQLAPQRPEGHVEVPFALTQQKSVAPPVAPQPPAEPPVPSAPPMPPPAPPVASPAPSTALTLEALQAKLNAEDQAITTLQKEQQHALQTIALLDAFARLQERVLSSSPYADELARLRALGGNSPTINKPLAALESHAGCGIPALDTLARDFPLAARRALTPAEQGGILAWLKEHLSHVISIRRIGDVPGDSDEAVIARAEQDVENNRVPHAIDELASLKGTAREAMQPWVKQAEAYAARDAALADLRTAILNP